MTDMISPRAPRDGDRSRKATLPDSCRAIGAQLAAARDTRQISVEAAVSKLLLSKGQVIGLEHGDSSPFYSTDFFLRGLRKYMAFMGLPADLLVENEDEEEGGLRLMLAEMAPRPRGQARQACPAHGRWRPRWRWSWPPRVARTSWFRKAGAVPPPRRTTPSPSPPTPRSRTADPAPSEPPQPVKAQPALVVHLR